MQLNANLKMTYLFALTPDLFLNGFYWQIFTYGFLHSTFFDLIPFHILMNMYGFYMLGMFIEPVIGKMKLVLLYFAAQLGGGVFIIGNALIANYIVMPENHYNRLVHIHLYLGLDLRIFQEHRLLHLCLHLKVFPVNRLKLG